MTLTVTTLVTGAHAAAREAAIAQVLDPAVVTFVILEGIASGLDLLESKSAGDKLQIIRIAPGCMCCIGNLTLRVNLNRILRKSPLRLFIALATDNHLMQVREFLLREPYDAFLTLTEDLHIISSANHSIP